MFQELSNLHSLLTQFRPRQQEPEPHAYLVKETNSCLTLDELLGWVRDKLPIQLHPTAGIEFLDSLPIAAVSTPHVLQGVL